MPNLVNATCIVVDFCCLYRDKWTCIMLTFSDVVYTEISGHVSWLTFTDVVVYVEISGHVSC
jgi:hypothetical protein